MTVYDQVAAKAPFEDRYVGGPKASGVDVVIPLLHATPFWKQNLYSYYREIPIRRLLIGNAGAIDGSDVVASEFPRAVILDHTHLKTLGRSIAVLISEVTTEHFIYLQSDAYLPEGWFDVMESHKEEFDWFGCPERPLIVLSGPINDQAGRRPLAGSQFGRTSVFTGIAKQIQDDYGYRQEDFIFEDYALKNGGKVGGIYETFHIHQITERKTTGRQLSVRSFALDFDSEGDDSRVLDTQLLGFIKYCDPRRPTVSAAAYEALLSSFSAGRINLKETFALARRENQVWILPLLFMLVRALDSVIPRLALGKFLTSARRLARKK